MTKPGPSSVLIVTAAADDVKMTRLTVFALTHAFKTFCTPWIAGLIMSFYTSQNENILLLEIHKKSHDKTEAVLSFCTSGSSEAK